MEWCTCLVHREGDSHIDRLFNETIELYRSSEGTARHRRGLVACKFFELPLATNDNTCATIVQLTSPFLILELYFRSSSTF